MFRQISLVIICLTLLTLSALAQTSTGAPAPKPGSEVNTAPPATLSKEKIPAGARIYIAPLNGYESFISAAVVKKETPVVIVNSADKADYTITGVSESVQAGWAKMLFLNSQQSNEQASIVMTNIKTGVVVWGYNVNKTNSYKGKQSSSEACAKHLKARIEGKE